MLAWMSRRSSSTDASAVAALADGDDGEDDAATDENYLPWDWDHLVLSKSGVDWGDCTMSHHNEILVPDRNDNRSSASSR